MEQDGAGLVSPHAPCSRQASPARAAPARAAPGASIPAAEQLRCSIVHLIELASPAAVAAPIGEEGSALLVPRGARGATSAIR